MVLLWVAPQVVMLGVTICGLHRRNTWACDDKCQEIKRCCVVQVLLLEHVTPVQQGHVSCYMSCQRSAAKCEPALSELWALCVAQPETQSAHGPAQHGTDFCHMAVINNSCSWMTCSSQGRAAELKRIANVGTAISHQQPEQP
jgi:hypothetical protein